MLSNCSYAIGWAEVIWLPYSIECLAGINLRLMRSVWNVFDKFIIGFIRERKRGPSLVGKTLINHWIFIKFIWPFHREIFVLYNISSYFVCCIEIKLWNKHNCIHVVWCKMHRQLAVGFWIHAMVYDQKMHWNGLYQYPWLLSIVS